MEDRKDDSQLNTPYDDAFRTMMTDSSQLAIALINEMFGKHIDKNATLVTLQNEVYLAGGDKRITDSHIDISGEAPYFHLECESNIGNAVILIRLFEYDSAIALKHAVLDDDTLYVRFPMTGVLYLRDSKKTKDSLKMVIENVETGNQLDLDVAVMKVSDYTLDDIFEKKLWFLLPFYIFNHESGLKSRNEERHRQTEETILSELRATKDKLDDLNKTGEIDILTRHLLEDMIVNITKSLARHSDIVKEGVNDIMGGKVLEYEAKTILNKGISEGRTMGLSEGMSIGFTNGRSEGLSEGFSNGRAELAIVIQSIRKGMTEDELLRSGFDKETIDLAKKCLE